MVIAVLDDHPMIRTGLGFVLTPAYRDAVIHSFERISDAIECCRSQKVDVAIIDLHLRDESGFDFLHYCNEEDCQTKPIVLTSSVEFQDYKKALELGAQGYLLKESLPEDIIYAVNMVLRNRKYIDPFFLDFNEVEGNHPFEVLTDREFEAFELIGKGYTNSEIADRLFISKNTVKKHVTSIISKLDVVDRIQIVILAQEHFRRNI